MVLRNYTNVLNIPERKPFPGYNHRQQIFAPLVLG